MFYYFFCYNFIIIFVIECRSIFRLLKLYRNFYNNILFVTRCFFSNIYFYIITRERQTSFITLS